MNDIGKRIRTLREEKGMTQEELAHAIGYKSRVSINKIELQRDVPIKKVVPIAKALGISPRELMGWEEEDISDPSRDVMMLKDTRYKQLYNKYVSLTDEEKDYVENTIDFLLSKHPRKE